AGNLLGVLLASRGKVRPGGETSSRDRKQRILTQGRDARDRLVRPPTLELDRRQGQSNCLLFGVGSQGLREEPSCRLEAIGSHQGSGVKQDLLHFLAVRPGRSRERAFAQLRGLARVASELEQTPTQHKQLR